MTTARSVARMWHKTVALYSYLVFGLMAVVALITLPLLLVLSWPFDRTRALPGRALRLIAVVIAFICPLWRLEMENARRKPSRRFVAVANHESMLDIFLISHVGWEMKWVAKESIFRIPVFGWLFSLSGDIPVKRDDRDSGTAALEQAERYLRAGMPVMFFPEGTRSKTNELRPFKLGAFRAAIRTGSPILPIAVHGTRDGMPVGDPWIRRAHARGVVLPLIETTGLSEDDAAALADRVRTLIIAKRDELIRAGFAVGDQQAPRTTHETVDAR